MPHVQPVSSQIQSRCPPEVCPFPFCLSSQPQPPAPPHPLAPDHRSTWPLPSQLPPLAVFVEHAGSPTLHPQPFWLPFRLLTHTLSRDKLIYISDSHNRQQPGVCYICLLSSSLVQSLPQASTSLPTPLTFPAGFTAFSKIHSSSGFPRTHLDLQVRHQSHPHLSSLKSLPSHLPNFPISTAPADASSPAWTVTLG